MSKDFLLEIGVEEMPARFIRDALNQLQEKTEKWLQANRLSYQQVKSYATPRRLAIVITKLVEQQENLQKEVKGPARQIACDMKGWKKPALGFANKQGITPEQLCCREIAGVEYVFAIHKKEGQPTTHLLLSGLPDLITSLSFPKNMRWGECDLKFIRPIRWLVTLYGNEILPFEIAGVKSGNMTYGHRVLGDPIFLFQPTDYVQALREQHVLVDIEERKQAILQGILNLNTQHKWSVQVQPDLLEEILFLVEIPTVFSGTFQAAFLNIPKEVLITCMREHQRYFPVFSSTGELLPNFVAVDNGDFRSGASVVQGNEKVLHARLADARFFYEEDRKNTIPQAMDKLENVIYHERLGSVAAKMRAVKKLAVAIAKNLDLSEQERRDISRAAEICKFDLVSKMVYEFPELQGIMGEDYARSFGERENVAIAIKEHYSPRYATDQPASTVIGAIVSIADKMNTIVSCFVLGLLPTGSQDPYALRRHGAGILSTMLKYKLDLTLEHLFTLAILHRQENNENKQNNNHLKESLQDFFHLRVKSFLTELGIRYDVIDAVTAYSLSDISLMVGRAQVLNEAVRNKQENFLAMVQSFNRVTKLVAKADSAVVDFLLFEEEAERELFIAWEKMHKPFEVAFSSANLTESLALLGTLRKPITSFLEQVMVMDKQEMIRQNRLALLLVITLDFRKFADFSRLNII